MEILIKETTTGTEDRLGNIYEFWIQGKLKSGLYLKIFADERFDLRDFVNQKVECLISAYKLYDIRVEQELTVDINKERMIGRYIGKFDNSEKWNLNYRSEWFYAMETIDGIIVFYRNEFEDKLINQMEEILNRSLEYGDIFSFYAEEFELEAWRSI
jgi:hypothetical protein